MSCAFTSIKAVRFAYMYGNNNNHTQRLKIIKKTFPIPLVGVQNYWENIFFRPEEAMFDDWQKLVSTNKNLFCS